jgi:hypothetical protein
MQAVDLPIALDHVARDGGVLMRDRRHRIGQHRPNHLMHAPDDRGDRQRIRADDVLEYDALGGFLEDLGPDHPLREAADHIPRLRAHPSRGPHFEERGARDVLGDQVPKQVFGIHVIRNDDDAPSGLDLGLLLRVERQGAVRPRREDEHVAGVKSVGNDPRLRQGDDERRAAGLLDPTPVKPATRAHGEGGRDLSRFYIDFRPKNGVVRHFGSESARLKNQTIRAPGSMPGRVTVFFRGRPRSADPDLPLWMALGNDRLAVIQRSIRYHRPRAPFCGRGFCTQCLVRVNGQPNVRACDYRPQEGDRVETENAWPSPSHDLYAAFDVLFVTAGYLLFEHVILED